MLSNAYFLAKFRFDTAENEPAKNLQIFANFPNFASPRAEVVGGEGHVAPLNGAYRLFTDIGDRPAYRQPPGEWPQLLWSLPRTAFQSPETFPQV